MQSKLSLIISILAILLLSGCSNKPSLPVTPVETMPKGTIFFNAYQSNFPERRMYMVTMPERKIQEMGYENSNSGYAISNDGSLIALTCFDDSDAICILETSSIIDKTKFVSESNDVGYGDIFFDDIKRFSFPDKCVKINEQPPKYDYPLRQMSWSYDNSKLSIICGDKWEESILCIMGMDGTSSCFPETTEKRITYAAWSPVNDTLAVSSTTDVNMFITSPMVYLFEPKSGDFQPLFSGFAPAWSPDGNRIASFFIYQTEPIFKYGLQVYSLKDMKNLTLLPNEQSKLAGFSLIPEVAERNNDCTISWSMDESQLVFSSRVKHFNSSNLLLYDFDSGNIQFLIDPDLLQAVQVYPQWTPFELNGE